MSRAVCNRDCFHCSFPDCIEDWASDDELDEIEERNRADKNVCRKKAVRTLTPEQVEHQRVMTWLYRQQNKERIQAAQRAYREANRDQINEKKCAVRRANPEKARADAARWRKGHEAERAECCKRWRQANKEKVRACKRAYYEKHKEEINARQREKRRQKKLAEQPEG